ncbi:MAG: hypothetical protein ACSHYF_08530 [Verrucomicrobiaceae bacterium]
MKPSDSAAERLAGRLILGLVSSAWIIAILRLKHIPQQHFELRLGDIIDVAWLLSSCCAITLTIWFSCRMSIREPNAPNPRFRLYSFLIALIGISPIITFFLPFIY